MISVHTLALATLAAATLSGPAPAQTAGENWRQVHTQGNVTFSIDLNSIKTVDGLRRFRVRATQPDSARIGYFDNAANCTAKTVDTLYAEVTASDGSMHKQAFKPGEMRNSLDDAEGKMVYPVVCGQ